MPGQASTGRKFGLASGRQHVLLSRLRFREMAKLFCIGLFGAITNLRGRYPAKARDVRDNAVAAAYKFLTEARCSSGTPTASRLSATASDPTSRAGRALRSASAIASGSPGQSMCATDEGKEKGDRWCKRASGSNASGSQVVLGVGRRTAVLCSFARLMWRQRSIRTTRAIPKRSRSNKFRNGVLSIYSRTSAAAWR